MLHSDPLQQYIKTIDFILTGAHRAFRYELARDLFPWVKSVPRALVQTIGIAEILGALGLILPVAAGIYS